MMEVTLTPSAERKSEVEGEMDLFRWLRSPLDSTALEAPLHALELDLLLWRGYHEQALPRLHQLLNDGPPPEMAAAGWVISRWSADKRDYQAALNAIKIYHSCPNKLLPINHAGPFLLAVQCCVKCGELDLGEKYLALGIDRFGNDADFEFALLSLAIARGAKDIEISELLKRLYSNAGLTGVKLCREGQSLFDRLQGESVGQLDLGAMHPLVSIIVPVFNSASQLSTALRGLQQQSWPNIEIVIVDDGSSDESLSLANAASNADPRIRVIALGRNQGAYPARNAGFREARGALIAVHDADDWSHPQKIELQARALIDNPTLKASVSHWVRASNKLEMTRWRIEDGWIHRNVSSLMIRAELREEIGYWDRAKVNADTEYYYRIARVYGDGAIGEVCPSVPLAFGRTAAHSLTNSDITHMRTQYNGVRHEYMEAAHYWHQKAKSPNMLYMPQFPARRPFNIPRAISLADVPHPVNEYDLLSESGFFDAAWYLQSNPDALQTEMGAIRHYLTVGVKKNTDPSPTFSSSAYRLANNISPQENPLIHYLNQGQASNNKPLPFFPGRLSFADENIRNVLVFAHTSGNTLFGAERSFLSVVAHLARKGLRPVVVLPALQNTEYLQRILETSAGVEVIPQLWRNSLYPVNKTTVSLTRELLQKYMPVEIHVNTLVQEAPVLAALAEQIPSVMYVRELPADDPTLCRALGFNADTLRLQLLEQVSRFIVPSQAVADWLNCPARVTVRPNAVDEDLFNVPFAPGRFLNVALISSNIAKKGLSDFIDVANLVAQTGRAVRFLIIGPRTGELLKLQPLPPSVRMCDYTSSPIEAISQADIVLSLSQFAESFGRTVVEAMAAGRPVICYDHGAPPTLVRHKQSGFVVPFRDVKKVADAILNLDLGRVQLKEMSLAARRRARELQDQALA